MWMDIRFRSTKLQKVCNDARKLQAGYGQRCGKLIARRLQSLRAAKNLGDFLPPNSGPERTHELTGDRHGQISMDVEHPYRLVFVPQHNPYPTRPEGGLDWFKVTAIEIQGVEDTHD